MLFHVSRSTVCVDLNFFMDKNFVSEISNFYNLQRIESFLRKREKSIIIPHVSFYIERLIQHRKNKSKNQKIEISILDIGCGGGNLLKIIDDIFKVKFEKKYPEVSLVLHGWDYDAELIEQAKKDFPLIEFQVIDLLSAHLELYYGKYDLVLAVNTFHEVFTAFLRNEKSLRGRSEMQFHKAKNRLFQFFRSISHILSEDGTMLVFDGLDSENADKNMIKFRVKNNTLRRYVQKVVRDNLTFKMKIKNIHNDIYESSYRDFVKFITYFKFLNSKLWEIESKECYQYFTLSEFERIFEEMGLIIESVNTVSNDLGLYRTNVEIITEDVGFPVQAVLLVGSRHYIPTEFDYFCADLSNGNNLFLQEEYTSG